jgi:hypothetical protein
LRLEMIQKNGLMARNQTVERYSVYGVDWMLPLVVRSWILHDGLYWSTDGDWLCGERLSW